MRILRVVSSVNPEAGGVIESILQFSHELKILGCETDILCLDKPESPWLNKCPFKVFPMGEGEGKYRYSKLLGPWLEKHADNYDQIIIDGIWQYHSYGTYQALKKSNIPYYVFTHGMLDPWFKKQYPLKHLKKWLYWPWAEYRVLRDARAVFFTCEQEKLLAKESFWLYKCNEIIVSLGIRKPIGDAALQKQRFLRKFPELREKTIILFLSRIAPKKGCDNLIEAFSKLDNHENNYQLVMAGPDQVGWESELKSMAEELDVCSNITWTGMLSGELKWGAYSAADVFILPSHQENFGIVVVEALASSLPVLITDKVNIWQEIKENNAGLVEDDTVKGTVHLLRSWLSLSEGEQDIMRNNAKSCFTERFEISNVAKRFVEVLAS